MEQYVDTTNKAYVLKDIPQLCFPGGQPLILVGNTPNGTAQNVVNHIPFQGENKDQIRLQAASNVTASNQRYF